MDFGPWGIDESTPNPDMVQHIVGGLPECWRYKAGVMDIEEIPGCKPKGDGSWNGGPGDEKYDNEWRKKKGDDDRGKSDRKKGKK